MSNTLAKFGNIEGTIIITVQDDISYEITRNGYTAKTDMSKWYMKPESVVRHIENDIKDGYYPNMYRIVEEA